jgi:hypothetical protein
VETRLGENQEPAVPEEARDLSREEILSQDDQLRRAFEAVREI